MQKKKKGNRAFFGLSVFSVWSVVFLILPMQGGGQKVYMRWPWLAVALFWLMC
jgi:hypothetical protein